MNKDLPEDGKSSFFDGLLFKITLSPIGNNVEKNTLRGIILERFWNQNRSKIDEIHLRNGFKKSIDFQPTF